MPDIGLWFQGILKELNKLRINIVYMMFSFFLYPKSRLFVGKLSGLFWEVVKNFSFLLSLALAVHLVKVVGMTETGVSNIGALFVLAGT